MIWIKRKQVTTVPHTEIPKLVKEAEELQLQFYFDNEFSEEDIIDWLEFVNTHPFTEYLEYDFCKFQKKKRGDKNV